MPASRVVPALDVPKDRGARRGSGRPGLPVDLLLFEAGVEGLADGVVIAIADRAHRDLDPGLGAAFGEQHRGELAALIRMVNQAAVGATSGQPPSRALRRPGSERKWSAIDQPTRAAPRCRGGGAVDEEQNALIGVAVAADYPGIVSRPRSGSPAIFRCCSMWPTVSALGVAAAQTVFDGGLRGAHSTPRGRLIGKASPTIDNLLTAFRRWRTIWRR